MSPARPRPPPCRTLRNGGAPTGAPSIVSRSTGSPRSTGARAPSVWKAVAHSRAPFSPWSRRRARQRDRSESSSASVTSVGSPCGSRERHDARCVGPISAISRLRTSTRASPVLDRSSAFAPAVEDLVCFTAERVALVGPTIALSGISLRQALLPVAVCVDRTSDTPVASFPLPSELALLVLPRRPPRSSPDRSRERALRQ
jgi:hypothetical protein